MRYLEAIILRDEMRQKLIGKVFDNRKGWDIKDIIISPMPDIGKLYCKMYDANITNEASLLFFPSTVDDYKVYVISHQWPWGSGDLLFEAIESYLKHNTI